METRQSEAVRAEVFTRMPDHLRRPLRTPWADANFGGGVADCFLEGPSFDKAGNLWVVDIPHGRIFRISPGGEWSQEAQYDGWPNGLAVHADGRVFIADYRNGLMVLDPATGAVSAHLATRHSEGFKGVNDLHFASNGDLFFTDQGQTGLHDPTGRLYRLDTGGRLTRLLSTGPSPNGLVLNREENQVLVAMTRGNAVWRVPLMGDGYASKVGLYIQLSGGTGGPDGMALDAEGGLVVCHLGTTVWRFDRLGRATHHLDLEEGLLATNCAFGGPENRDLYVTESRTGTIFRARMPVPGQPIFAHRG